MIRKYYNHKPQTTPWHREEEPINHHKTPGRQIKHSNQLSLPHQGACNARRENLIAIFVSYSNVDGHVITKLNTFSTYKGGLDG